MKITNYVNFSALLKNWMLTCSLNQRKLSDLTGIPQSRLSEYLHSKAEPTMQNLQKLASAFDVSLSEFFLLPEKKDEDQSQAQTKVDQPEFSPEQIQAIEAFKKCLKFGGEAAEMLAKNAIELANKKQTDSGFLRRTEKRQSA